MKRRESLMRAADLVLSSQPDKPLSLDQKVGALLEKTLKLIDGDSCSIVVN